MSSTATLVQMLAGEKAIRCEKQPDVPDHDGSKPFAFSIDGKDLQATNSKGADWKQILNKAKEFTGDLTQQFAALKEWLEGDWRGNAKRAGPSTDPATAAAEHAPVRSKPALGQPPAKKLRACAQLQPRAAAPFAAPSDSDETLPNAFPPGALDALARLVAKRLPDTRALQNGGVGDQLQLSDRLQRIEDGQGRLVELAVAEYIKQNEGSVRAAAVRKYSKANRHDQAFVAEAQRAYAERHHSTIVAAAATEYMKAHEDDEDFREKAVVAYIAKHEDSEELKDAAAEKYMGEHEDDEDFREEAVDAYIVKHEDSEELKDAAADRYKEEHEDDGDFVEAAHAKYNEEHEDEIREKAVDRYKCEHEDEDDFVEAAHDKYIEEHEEEILEAAAEKYKEEHEEEESFKAAAARLLADAL